MDTLRDGASQTIVNQNNIDDMIVKRASDPIPFLIARVRMRTRKVPINTAVHITPGRSISGVI